MQTSWADSVANAESLVDAASGSNTITSSAAGSGTRDNTSRPTRTSYFPPHLRNGPPSVPPAPSQTDVPSAAVRPTTLSGSSGGANRWGSAGGGSSSDTGRPSLGDGRSLRSDVWNSRTGSWGQGKNREVNPFGSEDEATDAAFNEQQNTGINFDVYDDVPIETSGHNVPPPASSFAEIDLGDCIECKY